MRVVFMGTPEFSVPALDTLVQAGHEVACVYTQPPRAAGRGQKERPSPVQVYAQKLGLPVRMPASLKGTEVQREFADLGAEIGVVVAYGLILPPPILEAPDRGCLNIHASLLPRWRGAAPIQRAVMAGDAETGVCIMRMDAGLDTGPVILRETVLIGADDTAGDLHDRLAERGAETIVAALGRLGGLPETEQPEIGASYADKVEKAEARIDWQQRADTVHRQINGLSPIPGAWCQIGAERVKILRARSVPGDAAPGTVLDGFTVACGEGAVQALEIQRPGRRPASAEEALRGLRLPDRIE